jgi:hypothetical protein
MLRKQFNLRRKGGINEAMYHSWRKKYVGLMSLEMGSTPA